MSKVQSLPLWFRKFLVDFVETGLAALLALNLALPTSLSETEQVALACGAALLGALVSAVRRSLPDFLGWVATSLGVNTNAVTSDTASAVTPSTPSTDGASAPSAPSTGGTDVIGGG